MKMLLYSCKAKPYLNDYRSMEGCNQFVLMTKPYNSLNGKIVAECDFKVEEITYNDNAYYFDYTNAYAVLKRSCLSCCEIDNYLKRQNGYAIHIKNLHIFDEPKELSDYVQLDKKALKESEYEVKRIIKAPQNMCYCYDTSGNMNVLISIKPEWLCKILNSEKTIEIRKKVLKEMINNERKKQ